MYYTYVSCSRISPNVKITTFLKIHCVITHLHDNDATTKNKSDKNPGIKLSVPITNNSDAPVHVHINKNAISGLIQEKNS